MRRDWFSVWSAFAIILASISPDGVRAYVANAGAKSVSVIETSTDAVVATVAVEFIPVHVSISPDGAHVYATNAGSNSVSVIDSSTNAVSAKCQLEFTRSTQSPFSQTNDSTALG
jgi:YVTN family beta-propeller protein